VRLHDPATPALPKPNSTQPFAQTCRRSTKPSVRSRDAYSPEPRTFADETKSRRRDLDRFDVARMGVGNLNSHCQRYGSTRRVADAQSGRAGRTTKIPRNDVYELPRDSRSHDIDVCTRPPGSLPPTVDRSDVSQRVYSKKRDSAIDEGK